MPMVMVDIAPPDPPAALARALLEACSAAVRVGRCALKDSEPGDPAASGVATLTAKVLWEDGAGLRVHIEVRMPGDGEPPGNLRNLDFAAADPPVERWRSVGLAIATLAGEMVSEPAIGSSTTPTKAPPTAPTVSGAPPDPGKTVAIPAPAPASQRAPVLERLWVSAIAVAGPGLSDGALRAGGWADLGWKPGDLPLFGRLSLGFAARPTDSRGVFVQWDTVTLGLGWIAGTGAFTVQPRAAASLDLVRAGVAEPGSGRKDSGTAVGFGVHFGAEGVFRLERLGIVASLDAWHLSAPTHILVADQRVGISAGNGWVAGLGLRLFLE